MSEHGEAGGACEGGVSGPPPELATNDSQGRSPENHQRYGPKRGRTADLYTASVALYQLSYEPMTVLGSLFEH